MRINTNISALNAHRQLMANTDMGAKAMEKLSSGLRINRAGDDAAGLAISEKMRGQIRGLKQASRNAQDGISLIQTAEGALSETHSILQRMRELAVQAASETLTNDDRAEIQKEITQLIDEIDRVADQTSFNTQELLNGDDTKIVIHIGANVDQNISIEIGNMKTESLGVGEIDVSGSEDANDAINTIDEAINTVSEQRSALGAYQNRLEHTISNLGTSAENLQAAESRIRDVDMAAEIMEFTKANILNQAATAMLAQANIAPQTVLQLLG